MYFFRNDVTMSSFSNNRRFRDGGQNGDTSENTATCISVYF